MKAAITFEIDTDKLNGYTDEHIAELWYIAQANPAPITDPDAGRLAEHVGREIISRWVKSMPTPLWNHQGRHAASCELADRDAPDVPKPAGPIPGNSLAGAL